jgi:hypothetical protein
LVPSTVTSRRSRSTCRRSSAAHSDGRRPVAAANGTSGPSAGPSSVSSASSSSSENSRTGRGGGAGFGPAWTAGFGPPGRRSGCRPREPAEAQLSRHINGAGGIPTRTEPAEVHREGSAQLPIEAPAVRARCERTAVQRCRATFDDKADFGSAMPILSVAVRWGRVIGWVCKPEGAGSNPARSISRNSRFAGTSLRSVSTSATAVRARCERAR